MTIFLLLTSLIGIITDGCLRTSGHGTRIPRDMLKSLTLDDFKCFRGKNEFPFAQITIMYGMNGRGKSSVSQALLLIAQTMVDSNDISVLQLKGRYATLGTFADVVNAYGPKNHFGFMLNSDSESVYLEFEEYPNKPQLGRINALTVDGISRFAESSDPSSDVEHQEKNVSATSDIQILQVLKSARYISAGRLGPQNSMKRDDRLNDDDLGVNGENLIHVLSHNGIDFLENVEQTLSYVLGGASIKINYKDADEIELFLNSKTGKDTFRPVNVGFGYSYVLPIIVSAFLAKNGSLLIIENPEAHLHPAAQSRIMKFLIDIAKEKNLQLIIETHSDHVVNGMRIAMKEDELGVTDAHVLYFSDDKPIKMITCDSRGTMSDYPDDFLDEWTLQALQLV